jgi:hypothetical protein
MLAGPTQEPGVAVLGLAASLEPGELALDVPGEIQPRVRERRAHAGEPLLHEGPQEGVALPVTPPRTDRPMNSSFV